MMLNTPKNITSVIYIGTFFVFISMLINLTVPSILSFYLSLGASLQINALNKGKEREPIYVFIYPVLLKPLVKKIIKKYT